MPTIRDYLKFPILNNYKIVDFKLIGSNRVFALIRDTITQQQYIIKANNYSDFLNNKYRNLESLPFVKVDQFITNFDIQEQNGNYLIGNIINPSHQITFGVSQQNDSNISAGQFAPLSSSNNQPVSYIFENNNFTSINLKDLYINRFIDQTNILSNSSVIVKEIKNSQAPSGNLVHIVNFNQTIRYQNAFGINNTPLSLSFFGKFTNSTTPYQPFIPKKSFGLDRLGNGVNNGKFLIKSQFNANENNNDIPVNLIPEIKSIEYCDIVFIDSKNLNTDANYFLSYIGRDINGDLKLILSRTTLLVKDNNQISIFCDGDKKCLNSWSNKLKDLFPDAANPNNIIMQKEGNEISFNYIAFKNGQTHIIKKITDINSSALFNENGKYPLEFFKNTSYPLPAYDGHDNPLLDLAALSMTPQGLQLNLINGDVYNCKISTNLSNCAFELNINNNTQIDASSGQSSTSKTTVNSNSPGSTNKSSTIDTIATTTKPATTGSTTKSSTTGTIATTAKPVTTSTIATTTKPNTRSTTITTAKPTTKSTFTSSKPIITTNIFTNTTIRLTTSISNSSYSNHNSTTTNNSTSSIISGLAIGGIAFLIFGLILFGYYLYKKCNKKQNINIIHRQQKLSMELDDLELDSMIDNKVEKDITIFDRNLLQSTKPSDEKSSQSLFKTTAGVSFVRKSLNPTKFE